VFREKVVSSRVDVLLNQEAKRFLKRFGFGALTEEKDNYLRSLARDTPCTLDQIKSSIRCSAELAGLHNHRNIAPAIRLVDRVSVDFVALSKQIFTPPVNIIRQYLQIKMNMGKGVRGKLIKRIKSARDFASVRATMGKLSEYEFNQIKLGIQHDDFTGPAANSHRIVESEKFESNLSEFFKSKNLNFLREDGIKKKYGRKNLTPDFLFQEEVMINGVKSKWVDAKNFMGTKHLGKMRLNKLKKQAKKYIEVFGSGAFVFSESYVSGIRGLNVPGLSLRDGQDFAPGCE